LAAPGLLAEPTGLFALALTLPFAFRGAAHSALLPRLTTLLALLALAAAHAALLAGLTALLVLLAGLTALLVLLARLAILLVLLAAGLVLARAALLTIIGHALLLYRYRLIRMDKCWRNAMRSIDVPAPSP
jgi:hypothetical protein